MDIYCTKITKIGAEAIDALEVGMMILFKAGLNAELENYCYSHEPQFFHQMISAGDVLYLGETPYPITAVGEVANQNLAELGHIAIHFDGRSKATLPGNIHVEGDKPQQMSINTFIRISTH